MPISRKFAIATIAALMTATPLLVTVQANATETKKDAVATATATQIDKDFQIVRTADDAYRALREIRGSRLAIFNGDPDMASKLAGEAEKDLQAAQMNAKDFAIPTKKGQASGDDYVPFDTSMSLAEGFVPDEAKATKLKEANEHIAKGKSKKAAEILKLANIDVTVAAAALPVNASVKHMENAVKLIGEKKFYEANLAMKAVEDSVVIESYGVDAVPTQGK